jgi:hypothetical protein
MTALKQETRVRIYHVEINRAKRVDMEGKSCEKTSFKNQSNEGSLPLRF